MALDFKNIRQGISLVPNTTTQVTAAGDIDFNTTTNKLTTHNGTTASPIVTEAHTATLTNKTLSGNTATNLISGTGTITFNTNGTITVPNATDTLVARDTTDTLTNKSLSDATSAIVDSIDPTKKILFDAGGTTGTTTTITSAQTANRVITLPNATTTLLGTDTTQTISNKTLSTNTIDNSNTVTLKDTLFTLQDDGDTTKQMVFQLSGITTSTIRILTVPNASTTIVGTDATQTLTNKTLGDAETYTQITTPSNPASGFNKLYFKSDNMLYQLTSGGTETTVTPLDSPIWAENYTLSVTAGSGSLTIALKNKAGNDPSSSDPVKVNFRSSTLTTGTYTTTTITSNTNMSLTFAGANTMGFTSGLSQSGWVYLFDDGGTPRIGVSHTLYDANKIATGTSTLGTSNRTIYTSGGSPSSKSFRILGKFFATNTTASWGSVQSVDIQPISQDPIEVAYNFSTGSAQTTSSGSIDPVTFADREIDTHGAWSNTTFTAPRDDTYKIDVNIETNGETYTSGDRAFISINKNGTNTKRSFRWVAQAGVTITASTLAYAILKLSAGDTITLTYNNNRTGGNTTIGQSSVTTYISIKSCGNLG